MNVIFPNSKDRSLAKVKFTWNCLLSFSFKQSHLTPNCPPHLFFDNMLNEENSNRQQWKQQNTNPESKNKTNRQTHLVSEPRDNHFAG